MEESVSPPAPKGEVFDQYLIFRYSFELKCVCRSGGVFTAYTTNYKSSIRETPTYKSATNILHPTFSLRAGKWRL